MISNLLTNEMEYLSYFNMENKIVKEIGSTYGTLYYTYDNYGHLTKITHTDLNYITTDYYVVVNGSEDVASIYSDNGELLARYSYDTWGNIISIKDKNDSIITDTTHIAHINPFRYKGYYYDKETGFYYLKTRYYAHRFINADDATVLSKDISSFDDKNLFTYCDNNPISRKDSQGDYWLYTTIRIAASITTSVCTDLIMAELNGELDKYRLEDFTASVLSEIANGLLSNKLLNTLATGAINYYLAKSKDMDHSDAVMMGIISSAGSFLGTGNIGNEIGKIYGEDAVLDVIIPSLLDIPTAIAIAKSNKSYNDYAVQKHNTKNITTSSTTITKSSTKNTNRVVGKFGMLG